MITRRGTLFGPAMLAFAATLPAITTNAKATNVDGLERVKIDLVAPPNVHPHQIVTKDDPKIFEFKLNIIEKEITLDKEGTKYRAMTYNGAIPGPMMIVHQDDYVEITLVNTETNEMPHNIDFHAATGALGGGALTMVNPGEQATLRFKATRPGVFIYHCAPTGMIPWHVVSGMSGVIMILPRDGLKDEEGQSLKYDKVFYIGENDFYVPRDKDGKYMSFESTGESFEDVTRTMRGLIPTHVVFNGKKGSLTGDNALKAKVGETVLIVHCQANRDTRPHLIGGHGDHVWEQGKFNNPPKKDLETWFVRGGSAAAALYKFLQPGLYAYVNHNLIEAAELGATAHVTVEGDWDNDLMMQVKAAGPIVAN